MSGFPRMGLLGDLLSKRARRLKRKVDTNLILNFYLKMRISFHLKFETIVMIKCSLIISKDICLPINTKKYIFAD